MKLDSRIFQNDLLEIFDKEDINFISPRELLYFIKITETKGFEEAKREILNNRLIYPRDIIINIYHRPGILTENDSFIVPAISSWERHLQTYKNNIDAVLPYVGRIELKNHPDGLHKIGTGFLIGEDIVITNAHVAEHFAKISDNGHGFEFKRYCGKKISAAIDFREEYFSCEERQFNVNEILYIANTDLNQEADLAFLRIDKIGVNHQRETIYLNHSPLKFSGELYQEDYVVAIGYPMVQDYEFDDINGAYKRISPGKITSTVNINQENNEFGHDCSTLGGSSGSPLIKLNTGEIVGVHYRGFDVYDTRKTNFAIVSEVIVKALEAYQ